MFKKSLKLLCEGKNTKSFNSLPTKDIADLTKFPVSNAIKGVFESNQDVLDDVRYPYELRGQYIPRRKVNPFKKNL